MLLERLGSRTLIITGIASNASRSGRNICVLFTANNAYMRDYKLKIPTSEENANALTQIKKTRSASKRHGLHPLMLKNRQLAELLCT
jgi:hypothetical protein